MLQKLAYILNTISDISNEPSKNGQEKSQFSSVKDKDKDVAC